MTFCDLTPLRIGDITVPGFMAGALWQERVQLGLWAFLIVTDNEKVLFDGGLVADMKVTNAHVNAELGADFGYKGGDATAVQKALAGMEVKPEDIDVAVLSHLHHDHAGALEWLPRAKFWIHDDELNSIRSPYVQNVAPDWQVTPGTRRALADIESSDRLVAWQGASTKLNDSIELIKVGGHTRGSVALVATTRPDWRIALLGDLHLTETHINQGVVPTTALDAYETIRSTSRLLDTANELWPGHAIQGPVLAASAAMSWPSANEWMNDD